MMDMGMPGSQPPAPMGMDMGMPGSQPPAMMDFGMGMGMGGSMPANDAAPNYMP